MAYDALSWYQWMHNNNLLSSWEEFLHALELRFGSSTYENHQQALFKLQQTSMVADYQKEFERLSNKVIGLPHGAILDCFISGIRQEIQNELSILHPTSISQVDGLAKFVESKLKAHRPYFSSPNRSTPHPRPNPPFSLTLSLA